MNRDYEVGYGKPPTATRFQKGQSGNPNGRRRKSASLPGLADLTIVKLLDRKVRVKKDGVATAVPAKEAIRLAQLQQALSGGRLQANRIMDEYAEAVVLAEAERAERYAFWTAWRTRHAGASFNWPRSEGDAPLLPHPLDVRIGIRSQAVRFVGPMDEEELPLFEATVVLAELLLVEAERMRRCAGEDDVLLLKHLAMIIYTKAAPSLGGPSPEEPEQAVVHRLVTMALETQSKSNTELSKRKKYLEEMLARAGRLAMAAQTQDQWTDCAVSLSSLTGSRRTARRKKQS